MASPSSREIQASKPLTRHEDTQASSREARRGVAFGIAAYGMWGCFPLFFSLFHGVPALEVLAHRIVWSCVFLAIVVTLLRRWQALRQLVRHPRQLGWIGGCAVLIALNWGLYIHAVETGHVLQASLGYFMTPLVNIALGMLVLRERLSRWQGLAIGLALIAVLLQLVMLGKLPWISLVLAMTFGTYGLLRKRVSLDALSGLLVETSLLAPLSLATVLWLGWQGQSHFTQTPTVTLLMLVSGIVTTLPLLAFAGAARRLSLSTVGFLMYLNPTLQFLLALWVFGEPIAGAQLTTFVLIWIGLGFYSVETWRQHRKRQI